MLWLDTGKGLSGSSREGITPGGARERWGARTVEIGIDCILEEGPRAKINELQLACAEVNQQVLVLDVPVHHAAAVAVAHRLQHLPEEPAGRLLVQGAFLRDEVEQVLHQLGPLHDDQVPVGPLVPVQQLDDPSEARAHLLEEDDLQGHHDAALGRKRGAGQRGGGAARGTPSPRGGRRGGEGGREEGVQGGEEGAAGGPPPPLPQSEGRARRCGGEPPPNSLPTQRPRQRGGPRRPHNGPAAAQPRGTPGAPPRVLTIVPHSVTRSFTTCFTATCGAQRTEAP